MNRCSECQTPVPPRADGVAGRDRRTCSDKCSLVRRRRVRETGLFGLDDNTDRARRPAPGDPPPAMRCPGLCQHCQDAIPVGWAYVADLGRSHWLCAECLEWVGAHGCLPLDPEAIGFGPKGWEEDLPAKRDVGSCKDSYDLRAALVKNFPETFQRGGRGHVTAPPGHHLSPTQLAKLHPPKKKGPHND